MLDITQSQQVKMTPWPLTFLRLVFFSFATLTHNSLLMHY